MPTDEEIRVVVSAKDQASDDLERVADKADQLDKKTPTVDVDARGVEGLVDAAEQLPGHLGEAAGIVKQMSGGVAGLAGGIGAAAAGAFALADSFADTAIEAKTLSELTGSTVEDASALQQVWGRTGADTKDLADVMLQVNGVLEQSPDLARQLSIEGGNVQDRFISAVEAVRGIQDPIERARIGSQLFGEEGVRQVGAVIATVDDLGRAVGDMDPLVSDEDVESAKQFRTAMADLRTKAMQLGATIADDLVPALTEIAESPVADKLFDLVGLMAKLTEFQAKGGFGRALADGMQEASRFGSPLSFVLEQIRGGEEDAATAAKDFAEATGETAGAVDDLTDSTNALIDAQLQAEGGQQGLIQSADTFADSIADLAAAQADGATTAEEMEDAVWASNSALRDTKTQVLRYVQEIGTIPPDVETDFLAQIPPEYRAELQAFIRRANQGVDMPVRVKISNWTDVQNRFRQIEAGQMSAAGPASAPTTVNVHMPRGTRAADVLSVMNRHARRNGVR
jgi:methyl-accepting chemotaxis protein